MAMPAPFPTLDEAQRLPVDTIAIHTLWYLADITPNYDHRPSFLLRRLRDDGPKGPQQLQVRSYGDRDLDHPAARAYNEAWEWLPGAHHAEPNQRPPGLVDSVPTGSTSGASAEPRRAPAVGGAPSR